MCNLSQGIREEGQYIGFVRILTSFMESLHISFEEAADLAKLSIEDRQKCQELMSQQ